MNVMGVNVLDFIIERSTTRQGPRCSRDRPLVTKDTSRTIDSVNLPSIVKHNSLTLTGTYSQIAFSTPCPGILFKTSKLIPTRNTCRSCLIFSLGK